MAVPPEMRQIEHSIDKAIQQLPIWHYSRNLLLKAVSDYYLDAIEVIFLSQIQAKTENNCEHFHYNQMLEQDIRFGVFQALKWAMEFPTEHEGTTTPSFQEVHDLIDLGKDYEVIVDFLKCAGQDLLDIVVDQANKVITIYEGGDLTGADSQLTDHQHRHLTNYQHVNLTEDDDQLTSKWNAGEFRRAVKFMAILAKRRSHTVCYNANGTLIDLFSRPTLIELPDMSDPALNAVMEDLTLSPEKVQGDKKWHLTTFFDMPLIRIGDSRFGVSDVLIALWSFAGNDHMLRVASRVDPDQYTKVSGLREDRMITLCKSILENKSWHVEPHKKVPGPPQREIDIFAHRRNQNMVLQLKSTLRPEAPWEVHKRNQDLIEGVEHTSEILNIIKPKPIGFVITDGYCGDFISWTSALGKSVPIGTLRDLADIAENPEMSITLLKQRVGFDFTQKSEPIPDRDFDVMGWKFRVVDTPSPSRI